MIKVVSVHTLLTATVSKHTGWYLIGGRYFWPDMSTPFCFYHYFQCRHCECTCETSHNCHQLSWQRLQDKQCCSNANLCFVDFHRTYSAFWHIHDTTGILPQSRWHGILLENIYPLWLCQYMRLHQSFHKRLAVFSHWTQIQTMSARNGMLCVFAEEIQWEKFRDSETKNRVRTGPIEFG